MLTRKNDTPSIHPSLLASDLGTSVPLSELEVLDRRATLLSITAGTQIVRADDYGRECFVVVDGEFEVQLDDTTVTVGPGSVIGEMALLTLKPRNASVTASSDAVVYVMNRSEFETVLDECPKLARHVLGDAIQRSSATD